MPQFTVLWNYSTRKQYSKVLTILDGVVFFIVGYGCKLIHSKSEVVSHISQDRNQDRLTYFTSFLKNLAKVSHQRNLMSQKLHPRCE